ncbi:unnamed protein product [Parnassius apollo]|uniref:(apollo) hypothetical protein n=1 Tax=Parnassius apollo TaxID=110799 RepID=A0A8S3Y1L6_PARAO|nr:unnamed protein product [Parnassius apollo]
MPPSLFYTGCKEDYLTCSFYTIFLQMMYVKKVGKHKEPVQKHRNKRKTKSRQGAVAIKKYKYEESLNVLLPHIQDRNTITSIESENEETQNETVTSPVTTPTETINSDEQQQQEDRSPAISETNFTPPADPNPYPLSTTQFTRSGNSNRNATVATTHNRRRIVPQSQSSASSALMEYILKNKEKSNTQDIHPIDAFFNGLAATIKSFPLTISILQKEEYLQ